MFLWGGSRRYRFGLDNPSQDAIVANEGLGWDSLLKMVHNPGGHYYWEGGQPKRYP